MQNTRPSTRKTPGGPKACDGRRGRGWGHLSPAGQAASVVWCSHSCRGAGPSRGTGRVWGGGGASSLSRTHPVLESIIKKLMKSWRWGDGWSRYYILVQPSATDSATNPCEGPDKWGGGMMSSLHKKRVMGTTMKNLDMLLLLLAAAAAAACCSLLLAAVVAALSVS